MDLRDLRYFAAVVEAGSITGAANSLRLSQPSLSVAMGRLEAELGVALLLRSPRGVEPTSAGKYLLDASSRLLAEVDVVTQELRRFGAGLAGSFTIAAVPVLMWHRLPRLLRSLALDAPGVEVRLTDPPPWVALDLLERGRVDLAAIAVADPLAFAARYGHRFQIIDWGELPLVAVLPPDWEAPEPFPALGFQKMRLMLPQRVAAVASLPEVVEAFLRDLEVTPGGIVGAETIQSGIPLIEAGLAGGILPDPGGAGLARFDVITRNISPAPPPLTALVLAKKGAGEDAALARLLWHVSQGSESPLGDPVRNPI